MTRLILAPVAAALLLAGCVQTYVSPVSVTRFVGAEPARLGQGPIAVVPAPGGPVPPDFAAFQTAVSADLARLGYQVVGGDTSASSSKAVGGQAVAPQVAEVRLGRAMALSPGRNPVSVGLGGETGSYGSGFGAGVGIDLTRPPPNVATTDLGVVIRDTASRQSLWEGRAQFTASGNTPYASPQATAQKMADALFAGFPGRSGETIEVK
jgi:hypothetical protein